MADLQTICVDNTCMNNPICCNGGYFTGTSDTSITQGTAFDPRAGVAAYDENDNPIPFVAVPDAIDTTQTGTYHVAYIANGVDPVVRTITVTSSAPTYRTVLYPDGHFIINESSADQAANEQAHGGTATNVYPAYDPSTEPYNFTSSGSQPWYNERRDILTAEVGTPIAPTSTARWFADLYYVTDIDLTNLDTSGTTDMSRMFSSANRLQNVNTELLDVSNVTTMFMMFYANNAIQEIDLCGWDTQSLTNTGQMFNGCSSLVTINTDSTFDVSNVTSSNNMFNGCTSLVGGSSTAYDANVVDKTRAKIDGGQSDPGYFTNCGGATPLMQFSTTCSDHCTMDDDDYQTLWDMDSIRVKLFDDNTMSVLYEEVIAIEDYDSTKTYTGSYAYRRTPTPLPDKPDQIVINVETNDGNVATVEAQTQVYYGSNVHWYYSQSSYYDDAVYVQIYEP